MQLSQILDLRAGREGVDIAVGVLELHVARGTVQGGDNGLNDVHVFVHAAGHSGLGGDAALIPRRVSGGRGFRFVVAGCQREDARGK